ncbi:MAG TPA: hypothetical protein EYN64_01700, partial [Flavobacteriales bacterium]|nr:hypothetical protein [Flavobacteriales bacterium]
MASQLKHQLSNVLKSRQIWISIIIILSNVGTMVYTIEILNQKKKLSYLAGIANHQQVLIETHLSQVLLESLGTKTSYEATRADYKQASKILRYGGELALGPDSAQQTILKHVPTKEIFDVILKNDTLFRKIILKSDHFLASNPGNRI